MRLFGKEFKRVITSLIFILTIAGIFIFIYSQDVIPDKRYVEEPEPNGYFGMKSSNDPELIMPEAISSLYYKAQENQYVTYPNGFYKSVKLNTADKEKMDKLISELVTVNDDGSTENNSNDNDFIVSEDGSFQVGDNSNVQQNEDGSFTIWGDMEEKLPDNIKVNENLTWERFQEIMEEVDQLLGDGSDYSETWITHRFGLIPVTYEEAVEDYKLMISEDKVSGTHARLFSDYAGIILGLLPVFPAVFLFLKDRKKIAPMIYTRRVSSTKLVLSRFAVLISAIMLFVFIICGFLTGIMIYRYGVTNIDILAYFKYALLWLLPTAMVSTAVGMFFTTLTGTPIAIVVQLLWWFFDMIGGSGSYQFVGGYSMTLIPRHNSFGQVQAFIDNFPQLIQGRIFITAISLVLVGLTVFIYEFKRRGKLNVSIIKHNKV